MGVFRRLVLLPLAPLEGLLWLARTLEQLADQELNDPARLRAVLEDAEAAHARGELRDDDLEIIEQKVLGRLVRAPGPEAAVTFDG